MKASDLLESLLSTPGHASSLGSVLFDLARNRLELARIEILEAKRRAIGLMFLAVLAALLCAAAVGLIAAAIILAVPAESRLTAVLILAACTTLLAIAAIVWFKVSLDRLTPPFEDLVRELKKDKELL